MTYPSDSRINVLAPVVRGRKGEFKKELAGWRQRGFLKARVDGQLRSLDEDIVLDRRRNHAIEIVVDRLIVKPGLERRLTESLEIALGLAGDVVVINSLDGGDRLFSRDAGLRVVRPEHPGAVAARLLVQLAARRAAPTCQGLGALWDFDPGPHRARPGPFAAGGRHRAVGAGDAHAHRRGRHGDRPQLRHRRRRAVRQAAEEGPRPDALRAGLVGAVRRAPTRRRRRSPAASARQKDPWGKGFEGVIPNLRRRYEQATWVDQADLEQYRSLRPCDGCHGERLRPESRAVQVKGRTISEFVSAARSRTRCACSRAMVLTEREELVAGRIRREIVERLRFLVDVGVGYLTLGRSAATLSGGEAQRIRLATQIGANLRGVLYVLDEPSIGLHQRDNRRLLTTLRRLRDLGNTVIVVEHDEETIRSADYVDRPRPRRGRARRPA